VREVRGEVDLPPSHFGGTSNSQKSYSGMVVIL
jgi:hypothetical protein